jgi:hypothetical protein
MYCFEKGAFGVGGFAARRAGPFDWWAEREVAALAVNPDCRLHADATCVPLSERYYWMFEVMVTHTRLATSLASWLVHQSGSLIDLPGGRLGLWMLFLWKLVIGCHIWERGRLMPLADGPHAAYVSHLLRARCLGGMHL